MDPFVGDGEVLVHIGLPKTGTTALQSCAAAAREDLLRHGVLFPGSTEGHVLASYAPLEWFEPPSIEARARRRWATLTAEVAHHDGRVLVSAENLCVGDEAGVRRVVEDLGGERVRAVLTVRGLHHVLPSFWQHEVRAGLQTSFDDWAAMVAQGPGAVASTLNFWVVFDVGHILRRWADVLGPDRVAVVVVDPQRPTGIFTDIAHLLGLPEGVLDPALADRSNRSLTEAEAEVIRRVNTRMEGVSFDDQEVINGRYIRPAAIRHLIEGRRPAPTERRLAVSAEMAERLRPSAEAAIADIERIAPTIVGDLRQLLPTHPRPTAGVAGEPAAEHVIDSVPIEAAILLIEALIPRRDATPPVRVAPDTSRPSAPLPRRLVRKIIPHRVRRAVVARRRR